MPMCFRAAACKTQWFRQTAASSLLVVMHGCICNFFFFFCSFPYLYSSQTCTMRVLFIVTSLPVCPSVSCILSGKQLIKSTDACPLLRSASSALRTWSSFNQSYYKVQKVGQELFPALFITLQASDFQHFLALIQIQVYHIMKHWQNIAQHWSELANLFVAQAIIQTALYLVTSH